MVFTCIDLQVTIRRRPRSKVGTFVLQHFEHPGWSMPANRTGLTSMMFPGTQGGNKPAGAWHLPHGARSFRIPVLEVRDAMCEYVEAGTCEAGLMFASQADTNGQGGDLSGRVGEPGGGQGDRRKRLSWKFEPPTY
ncbi:hypothetical protein R1flu_011228 [Riccia fluitans]|uniref:Uncharacterized protein n=1 Tax=Riccia fluitans TaxID=41844 RepID=A0ABD1Z774_9MARC